MLKKRCLFSLIIVLACLGFFSKQHLALPNQEMVLQFTNPRVTTEDVKKTINIVKEQLHALGVYNIQVRQGKNGKLKIKYFSDLDIDHIKESFLHDETLAVNFNSQNQNPEKLPSDNDTKDYNLAIYEIHHSTCTNGNLNGVIVLELEIKSNRFLEPDTFLITNNDALISANHFVVQSYKIHRNIVFKTSKASKSIPDVRAGPIC